jgi:hypothetical protein
MSASPGLRAELANQVLVRLGRFDDETWKRAAALLEERGEYFEMATGLAHHAVALMGEEHGAELEAMVRSRLDDADALVGGAPSDAPAPAPLPPRMRIARAAVLAAFLRDSHGFNRGAFEELFAPVAPFIDIGELERLALASIGADSRDFQVGAIRYEAPSLTEPHTRRRA